MACSGECTRKYYMFHSPAARIKDIKVQQAGAAEQPASNLSNDNQQTITNTIDKACDKLKYPGAPKPPPAAAPVYDNFGLPGRECEKDCVCSRYKEPKRRTEVPDDFSPVPFKPFELTLGGTKYTISGSIEIKEVEFAIGHCSVDFVAEPLTLPGAGGG